MTVMTWTVDYVLSRLPRPSRILRTDAPPYNGDNPDGIMMAVESMRMHMTDEGWQIALALQHANYKLCGYNLPVGHTNVEEILKATNPGVVVVQDKREWDVPKGNFREPKATFTRVSTLASRVDLFKLTILKDSHQNPPYHRESAEEMGCHAWIIYYHPRVVLHNAPYVRPKHLIRTYHSIDSSLVGSFNENRNNIALLSGAISGAYPLRTTLIKHSGMRRDVHCKIHPGYHRRGCETPAFLTKLQDYKVAICTSSIYGYALRKLIEATACGCVVVTDLPSDEVLPEIDDNLIRVPGVATPKAVWRAVDEAYKLWNPGRQQYYATKALEYYDYRASGVRLAQDIERLRSNYSE